jgi:predicted ATPase
MNRFERIGINGFRRLYQIDDLKLKPLNVLIGANGCGKTSLLEVFSLLAASASGHLKETISAIGGVDANLTALDAAEAGKADSLRFELDMSVPSASPLKYSISFRPHGVTYEVVDVSWFTANWNFRPSALAS